MSSKLFLIVEREYVTRVRKLSFIIMSLLMPVGMLLLMVLPSLIMSLGATEQSRVAVVDRTERYGMALTDATSVAFVRLTSDTNEADLRTGYADLGYDAYMIISGSPVSKDSVKIYSQKTLPIEAVDHVTDQLTDALKTELMNNYAGHTAELDSLFAQVNTAKAKVSTVTLSDEGNESESFAMVGMVVALIAAMLIYMFVLTTGSMVMQGVVEEKANRIIEVLVSSVRPFELMMGKIIGIALVALTQLAIWIVCGLVLMSVAGTFLSTDMAQEIAQQTVATNVTPEQMEMVQQQAESDVLPEIFNMLSSINFTQLILLFIVYFIGGYLLYASLFAIVGAAIDNAGEGSQLSLIVMIPLFAAIYIVLHTMQDPNSALSVWASIIPFTSPIVMMARLPFDVPIWQIVVSILVLIGTFLLFTWIAARIYRVGILMYGKKANFAELVKWFKQSE